LPPTVLVVEDDPAIRRGLVDALAYAGYDPLECADAETAQGHLDRSPVDLVLLDVLLPDRTGFDLLVDIRRKSPRLPVIMVTARGAEPDRVRGLRDGADDYVVKPFSARELLARVEAVLRRASIQDPTSTLRVKGRTIDLDRREVTFSDGRQKSLTEREASILKHLVLNDGLPLSREDLLRRIWRLDPQGIRTRTVDMHVARLREKLEDDPTSPEIIVTVRQKGYMLARKASTNGEDPT